MLGLILMCTPLAVGFAKRNYVVIDLEIVEIEMKLNK